MTITINADLVALVIVGFIAGTAASTILGYAGANWLRNGLLGMLGAFIGAIIFDAFDLNDDIPEVLTGSITVADIFIAIVGAIVLMVLARRWL
jgi:uncharacterized membrane protein YeaQ/YmgE (transglycosylase-associated protein family)